MNADEDRNERDEREHKKRKTDAKNTKSFLCVFCVVFALFGFSTVYATDYGDVSVKIESVTEAHSSSGYDEYRVTIINRSPAKPHRVMVESEGGLYGSYVGGARRVVEAASASTATVALFLPQGSAGGRWIVSIDGERRKESVEIDVSRTSAWISHSQNTVFLMVSGAVEKSGLMNDAAAIEGFKNASGENEVAYLAYKSPMSEWSANWLGYSGFNAVIVAAEELREAPDGVRSALWRYVECGGSLVVIGGWEIPKQWRARRVNISETEEDDEAEEGSGEAKTSVKTAAKELPGYNIGFGQLIAIDADDVQRITPNQWEALKLGWMDSQPGKKTYYDIAGINRDFPVVERIGIPVRGLFVLMLAFVIVIGPINLIWLARRRKKIWMLWTVPAIAAVTCLAVAGFALFGEGVSATSRSEALTILDETSHRATTIGWAAFYSPITPGEGLHFSYDTELIPVMPENWRYGGGDRTIDFSNDQHFDSGWITARVPAYFRFRKSETRRERLTIRQAGNDSISVVNGFGADIRQLWFADRSGKIHKAEGVPAGAQAELTPAGLQSSADGDGLRGVFRATDWLEATKSIEQNPEKFLMPGCYLAVLEASPFVEEGLKNVKTRKARTLVYGISAEAER